MTDTPADGLAPSRTMGARLRWLGRALWGDPTALAAVLWLCLVLFLVVADTAGLFATAGKVNLKARNLPPFDFSQTWTLWLGGDALGRSLDIDMPAAAFAAAVVHDTLEPAVVGRPTPAAHEPAGQDPFESIKGWGLA